MWQGAEAKEGWWEGLNQGQGQERGCPLALSEGKGDVTEG